MLVLSRDELIALLSPLQIIAAVETAARAHAAGGVIVPKRLHVEWGSNTLLTMPAIGADVCGVKLVSVVPGNAARGLPVTNGMMTLNDGVSGIPFAVMDAIELTAQRTGAVGALGVKYLTPEATNSVGIVGCGVQGSWQAICACAVRPIREVFCVGRSVELPEKFVATVMRHAPGVRITPCRDVHELLERTDLVIAATTSTVPVLPDDAELLKNKHFVSIGSYKPTMQELPDSVYRLAGVLAVDSLHACHETGDVINPLRRGILNESDIFSIAECVIGKRTIDTAKTSAYKSAGSAMYDLFVAQAFYAAAKSRGLGHEIAL